MAADNDTKKSFKSSIVISAKGKDNKFISLENAGSDADIIVSSEYRNKKGGFASKKDVKGQSIEFNLESSLKEILKFLVYTNKFQSQKTDKTNDHLGNIENELTNLEKAFGQLTSFFTQKIENENQSVNEEQNNFQKINDDYLKNILDIEQQQLTELRMLNEQFIDFFEMNEKNIQDQKEQKIEREREAAAPPPLPNAEQPKQEAAKDTKKNEGIFSGFGSIVKNTFSGLMGIGKGIFKGLGTIFSTLFSIVSIPFKFIGSALGSILSFIPGFGIISKFMPSFNMGLGGLLSTLGVGALGYVGFKYLTDDKYKAGVDKYMGGITKFFSPFINAIKGFFDTPIGKAISSFVKDLWENNVKPALESTWTVIKKEFDNFMDTFVGHENWIYIKKSFLTITEWISNKLPKSYKELSDSLKIMANSIVKGFNELITFLSSIPILGGYTPREIVKTPFPEVNLGEPKPEIPSGVKTTEPIKTQDISKINLPTDINQAIDKKFSPQDALAVKQLVKSESGGINKENDITHDAGFFQFAPVTAWELLGRPNIEGINLIKGKYQFSDKAKIELSKRIRSLNAEQQTDLYLKYINPLTKTNTPLTFENLKAYGFASGKIPEAMKSQDLSYKIYEKDYGKEFQHFKQMQELSGGEGITYGGMLEWIRRSYLGKQPEELSKTSTLPLQQLKETTVSDIRNIINRSLTEDEKQQNKRDLIKRQYDETMNFGVETSKKIASFLIDKNVDEEHRLKNKRLESLIYGVAQLVGAPFGEGLIPALDPTDKMLWGDKKLKSVFDNQSNIIPQKPPKLTTESDKTNQPQTPITPIVYSPSSTNAPVTQITNNYFSTERKKSFGGRIDYA